MSKTQETTHSAHSQLSRLTLKATGQASPRRTKYTYDKLGQVSSGKRFWFDGTPVAGQQFEYGHDDIGNRTVPRRGGDAAGGGLRSESYAANRLNQYDSRQVPGYTDVLGIANPDSVVTVNAVTAYRKGDYWHHALATPNTGQAWYGTINVWSSYPPTAFESGEVFVPPATELFQYDQDGNLTNDGRWAFTWDGENRLVKMEPSGTVTAPTGSRRMLEFAYDHQGRRIWARVTNLDTSEVTQQRFVYDGWNLIAAVDPGQPTVRCSFVWGLDLSGTLQGAGGVGGLLKVTYKGTQTTNAFVAFDGNGNH